MEKLSGLATSRGFAQGSVFLYGGEGDEPIPECVVPGEGVVRELARYHDAREVARRQIEALADDLRARTDGREAAIFENHLLLFDDPMIVGAIERLIEREHLNAEAAIRRATADFRAVFAQMKDAYLRERVRDVDDLERRVLDVLLGRAANPFAAIKAPVILVAPDLTPSETVALPRDLILGFATDCGSTTSHVALLARALGIPAITGLGNVTRRVRAGEEILLDGTNGVVTLQPDAPTRAAFVRDAARERELQAFLADTSAATRSDLRLRLVANAQPGLPVEGLGAFGAQGIGLYRTEYLWLGDGVTPNEAVQTAVYTEAARAALDLGAGARTVFRVLDLGGDKLVRGLKSREANPFLGNRSLRWLLSHRAVFRTQLRAILRASAAGPSAIMYPMVATVQELREANAELDAVKGELAAQTIAFDAQIPVGCMIEIPSAALTADQLSREVQFFSIGTNDLVQYTLAADRGNESVSYLYQPSNPAVLRLVDMTIAAARAAGIPVSVCGESAANPVLAVLWAALGVDALSMSPSYIPVVRKTLSCLTRADLDRLAACVRGALDTRSAAEIYATCRAFVADRVPRLADMQTFFNPNLS